MSLLLSHLTHRFATNAALQDVSLHIRTGDCYGLIGHNGAGKTTVMRIALGLLPSQEGRVIIDGFDAARYPSEARARLGALVETPGFHGHLSGLNNLVLLARLQGLPRKEARKESERVLGLAGLSATGNKPARAYSQGMRQRLGIAQALLGHPPYVLLDEPTNGLDPEGLAEIRELLRRLRSQEGVTVLVSSHQLQELSDICNRVGVIREGRVLFEEELDELLAAGGGRYRLRARGDARAALEAAGVHAKKAKDGEMILALDGHEPGEVLRDLVNAGVEVESFAPQPFSLEEVYLDAASGRHRETGAEESEPAVAPPSIRRAPKAGAWRMFRYEAARWVSRAAVPLMVAMPALLGVFAVLKRKSELDRDQALLEAGELSSVSSVNAFEGVAVALQAGLQLLPYILLGLASQAVAAEFSQGTLRNVLLRPVRRYQVILGKACAALGSVFVSYALLAGVALAAAAWAFDFTGVSEVLPNGRLFELEPASKIEPHLYRALLSPLLPLCAFAGLGLLAGSVTRRGASGLGLALGLGVSLDFIRGVLRPYGLESLSTTAYVPSPLRDTSYIHYFADVAQGISNASLAYPATQIIVPAMWLLGTVVLSIVVFARRYVP